MPRAQRSRIRHFSLAAGLVAGLAATLVLAGTWNRANAQANSCEEFGDTLSDLYCFSLIPTPGFREMSGTVLLRPAHSPFGIAVTEDGTQKYQATLILSHLPDRVRTVELRAWVTTHFFEPIADLGTVVPGRNDLGEIALTKFVLFVGIVDAGSAEKKQTILRGGSPSTRLQGHDAAFSSPLAAINSNRNNPNKPGSDTSTETKGLHLGHAGSSRDSTSKDGTYRAWSHPPMHPEIAMAPGMQTLKPSVNPFVLSRNGADAESIPIAKPRQTVRLADGDTLDLSAGLVRRIIDGRELLLLGYNGQYPGPLIRASEASTIVVRFQNNVDAPTAVHWHGIRLENQFDGVPGITQDPVLSGESFIYRVRLPDPGLYWYHPHHREDIFQELGLYGNLLVDPSDSDYYNDVTSEEVLVLDDILLSEDGPVEFGFESANYMFMGRFGNRFLLNGSPDYSLEVTQGDVVRFYLTNVSNTRTFNLTIGGARVKVIASDVSRFEREEWVRSVVIAPAERYILEARFDSAGTFELRNNVQAINHTTGTYFPESTSIGTVRVLPNDHPATHSSFETLRTHDVVVLDIDRYRPHFDRSPDKNLRLTLETTDLPPIVDQTMSLEAVYFTPVEWSGTMPMMNWASTGNEVQWILHDPDSDQRNMSIDWTFKTGDIIKIRVLNDREAFHAMQHPLHIHGQRFLVVSQNGVRTNNLVWKDTVLLPSGSTTDLLLDLTNPGTWMVHCHIAEHLESGMKMVFNVR